MPVNSEVPPRFGRYEIVRYLGGGMSRVYEARDTVLDRSVALKLLADDMALDDEARTRFLREARFASGVESVIPVPISRVEAPLACSFVRGFTSVISVPPAPVVPTAWIVSNSRFEPVSTTMLWPTVMPVVLPTLM